MDREGQAYLVRVQTPEWCAAFTCEGQTWLVVARKIQPLIGERTPRQFVVWAREQGWSVQWWPLGYPRTRKD